MELKGESRAEKANFKIALERFARRAEQDLYIDGKPYRSYDYEGWFEDNAIKAFLEGVSGSLPNSDTTYASIKAIFDSKPDANTGAYHIALTPETLPTLAELFLSQRPVSLPMSIKMGNGGHAIWLTFTRLDPENQYCVITNYGAGFLGLRPGNHIFKMRDFASNPEKLMDFFLYILQPDQGNLHNPIKLAEELGKFGVNASQENLIYSMRNQSQIGGHCAWVSLIRAAYVNPFFQKMLEMGYNDLSLYAAREVCYSVEDVVKKEVDDVIRLIKAETSNWLQTNKDRFIAAGVDAEDMETMCIRAIAAQPTETAFFATPVRAATSAEYPRSEVIVDSPKRETLPASPKARVSPDPIVIPEPDIALVDDQSYDAWFANQEGDDGFPGSDLSFGGEGFSDDEGFGDAEDDFSEDMDEETAEARSSGFRR